MNYLAHIYLSFGHEDLMVGNFIADALPNNNISGYAEGIQKGIRLHRLIDTFTDSHPLFLQSKRRFSAQFDKYSGILIDIYYDHFLARNFHKYERQPLPDYAHAQYERLKRHYAAFPEHAQRFYQYMVDRDILTAYANLDSIAMVLQQLSHRIRHSVRLHDSIPVFMMHEKELEEEFTLFFEELAAYSKAQSELLLK